VWIWRKGFIPPDSEQLIDIIDFSSSARFQLAAYLGTHPLIPRRIAEELHACSRISPDQFVDDTPTAVLIRQILGAVAEFDKR
jgi:hypothetical protein